MTLTTSKIILSLLVVPVLECFRFVNKPSIFDLHARIVTSAADLPPWIYIQPSLTKHKADAAALYAATLYAAVTIQNAPNS